MKAPDDLVLDLVALPTAERLRLALLLWESVPSDSDALRLSKGQREMLRDRLRAVELDPDRSIPWEEVRSDILEQLAAMDEAL